jgi:hypothetical protein
MKTRSAEVLKIVDSIGCHFLFERHQPYLESGALRKKSGEGKRFALPLFCSLW